MNKHSSQETKNFVSKLLFDENIILRKNSSFPKISIVTPSYNQGQFLERTILSVLNQNYPNLEYIIIDGGSTDESVDIIKKYEKYLTYWVSEKDKGQSDAINKGFRKATGNILGYLNSDDTYTPDTFSKIANTFNKNPQIDLIYGDIHFIDGKDNKINDLKLTKLNFKNFIFENICLAQQATFWKKEIYDKVGGFNPNYYYSMDFDFFIRVSKIGHLMHLPEYLANFRLHQKSKTVTSKINTEKINTWQIENKKIKKQFFPKKINKIYFIFMKNLCRLQRIFNYIKQGDTHYVSKKVLNRIRGITFQDEIFPRQERD